MAMVLSWLSVGGLLPISNPIDFVRAMNVLMLEYENETESKQRMAPMFHRRQKSTDDLFGQATFMETGGIYLLLRHQTWPFDVDFIQSLFAFCDVMIAAYSKFLDNSEDVCNNAFVEAILRIDVRVKKILILILKGLDELARSTARAPPSVSPLSMLQPSP
ncbi:hypothetical protein BC829DRAFT_447439 [Chytridium lagenaria]|nr:hypothetical protein BC829DRAFT_447439 [Chytridium lagenaria]